MRLWQIILIGLLFGVVVIVINACSPTWSGIQQFVASLDTRPIASISDTQSIVTGIKPLGQLVSISVQLAKADIEVNVRQGLGNACGFSANHVAQGTIEAGIDLTLLDEKNIRYDETTDTYTLSLATPQLTSCRVDFIRQYDRSTTACSVDWDEARMLANYDAIIDFREDAIASGILTRAEQEANVVLTQFIQLLTQSKVVIEFNQGGYIIPPSCQPSTPPSWEYDMNNGQWEKR
jgi:hypothetical protein